MALLKPVLSPIAAFDATKESIFTFTQSGGSQVIKNQLTIRDNSTNTIVYQQDQTSFKYEHILQANLLSNNKYYNAVIITYDFQGEASPSSDPIQFYCYTQPTISITNMPNANIINNSQFQFNFLYQQIEGELLNYYKISLYDTELSQISTSGVKYVGSTPPPTSINYTFYGFNDNTTYYIEMSGSTVNNTEITTGKVKFSVVYITPNVYSVVQLTNKCQEGYVDIKTNISIVEGKSNPDPPIYIDNEELDVTMPDAWVKWDNGYLLPSSWTTSIWFRSANLDSIIATMESRSGDTLTLHYNNDYPPSGGFVQTHVVLNINYSNGGMDTISSNYIDIPEQTDTLMAWIRKVNTTYEVYLINTGSAVISYYLIDNLGNKLLDSRGDYLVTEEHIG